MSMKTAKSHSPQLLDQILSSTWMVQECYSTVLEIEKKKTKFFIFVKTNKTKTKAKTALRFSYIYQGSIKQVSKYFQ